jgi:hypothetical protein
MQMISSIKVFLQNLPTDLHYFEVVFIISLSMVTFFKSLKFLDINPYPQPNT